MNWPRAMLSTTLAVSLGLGSCSRQAGEGLRSSVPCGMPRSQEQAIMEVVQEHIHRRGWTVPDLPHVITEEKTCWLVTYVLPEDMLGGVPVVRVDKKSLNVTSSCHTQ